MMIASPTTLLLIVITNLKFARKMISYAQNFLILFLKTKNKEFAISLISKSIKMLVGMAKLVLISKEQQGRK